MKSVIGLIVLFCATLYLCSSNVYALVLKPGDPPPKPVPLFSRIRFNLNGYRFSVDAQVRCRYNISDRFMYRHNHPFVTPTNVYFEAGTVLNVTDTEIIFCGTTNKIGTRSCFLIEGNHIIPNRFVPDF